MALPAPSPVTTTTLQLPAQSSVCLAASVLREWWTFMEYVWTPHIVLVGGLSLAYSRKIGYSTTTVLFADLFPSCLCMCRGHMSLKMQRL